MYTLTKTIPHISESSPFHPEFMHKTNASFDVNDNNNNNEDISPIPFLPNSAELETNDFISEEYQRTTETSKNLVENNTTISSQRSNHSEIYFGESDTQNDFIERCIQFTSNESEEIIERKIEEILSVFDLYQDNEDHLRSEIQDLAIESMENFQKKFEPLEVNTRQLTLSTNDHQIQTENKKDGNKSRSSKFLNDKKLKKSKNQQVPVCKLCNQIFSNLTDLNHHKRTLHHTIKVKPKLKRLQKHSLKQRKVADDDRSSLKKSATQNFQFSTCQQHPCEPIEEPAQLLDQHHNKSIQYKREKIGISDISSSSRYDVSSYACEAEESLPIQCGENSGNNNASGGVSLPITSDFQQYYSDTNIKTTTFQSSPIAYNLSQQQGSVVSSPAIHYFNVGASLPTSLLLQNYASSHSLTSSSPDYGYQSNTNYMIILSPPSTPISPMLPIPPMSPETYFIIPQFVLSSNINNRINMMLH